MTSAKKSYLKHREKILKNKKERYKLGYFSKKDKKWPNKECPSCGVSEATQWSGDICYSCYQKEYYIKNKKRLKKKRTEYDKRFIALKSSAKRRKLKFNISIDDFEYLTKFKCFYCNKFITNSCGGLDRLDNNNGYTLENVVPCCTDCNRIRGNILTPEETYYIIQKLLEFRKKHLTNDNYCSKIKQWGEKIKWRVNLKNEK